MNLSLSFDSAEFDYQSSEMIIDKKYRVKYYINGANNSASLEKTYRENLTGKEHFFEKNEFHFYTRLLETLFVL
ncbi:MAG: hypothetical protein RSC93_00555 [Erysipelotrichaceae bacterium]